MSALPYVTAAGNIAKAIDGIKKAATPPKISQDFVKNMLGIKGGSGDQITSYLKKLGLADPIGKPTELYNRLRNPATSGQAIASCMRIAYKPLFDRNEYVHTLNDSALKGLIVEETGSAHDSSPVKMAFACFKALNELADFDSHEDNVVETTRPSESRSGSGTLPQLNELPARSPRLNIGYNIHLNLPATDDIAVFNAIFKSLKENLLTDDD